MLVYENSMSSFRSGMAIRLLMNIACAVFRNTEKTSKQGNSMLMRDVFAALLRDGEFASQFHMRPFAIPRH